MKQTLIISALCCLFVFASVERALMNAQSDRVLSFDVYCMATPAQNYRVVGYKYSYTYAKFREQVKESIERELKRGKDFDGVFFEGEKMYFIKYCE